MKDSSCVAGTDQVRLGLRENVGQFSLLVLVNAFVGAMIGLERTILPPIADQEFHLAANSAILSFIAVFGLTKAATNYFAGRFSDRFGRKHVLVAGWLVAIPVPFLLMWAPTWSWILFANALLGVSQGLTWSTTVIMKIDLAGPEKRGLAMGLNEFAGYFAVAGSALATGLVAARYGLRPEPFYMGVAFVAIGLLLSMFAVRETNGHVAHEARQRDSSDVKPFTSREVFVMASFKNRDLSSISQAGLVNNLNDGMAWGLFPLVYAARGMSLAQIGTLAAIYPAVWGLGQLVTGAWSDRIGRKKLIIAGKVSQAIGIVVIAFAGAYHEFAIGAGLIGLGTAMVYPTLLAAIGDVAHPSWRASAVGVYRLWRDSGYAIGALLAGVIADSFGVVTATLAVAALNLASGFEVAIRLRETLPSLKSTKRNGDSTCVDARSVHDLRQQKKALVIDVRSDEEFAAGHIAHAIHLPVEAISEKLDSLPRDILLVTVCNKGGGRSERAADLLRAHGLVTSRWLCGGLERWRSTFPDQTASKAG